MWRAKQKRSAAGRILKILGVLVFLCLAFIFAIPYLVNLDRYRTQLVQELSSRLGRPVEVSALRLRILPKLNVEVLGLRILDPPEFGGRVALTADSVRTDVRILPLLQGRLEIRSFGLERPIVVLRRNRDGFNNLFGEEYDDNVRLNARFSRTFEPAPKFNLYGGLTLAYHFGRP